MIKVICTSKWTQMCQINWASCPGLGRVRGHSWWWHMCCCSAASTLAQKMSSLVFLRGSTHLISFCRSCAIYGENVGRLQVMPSTVGTVGQVDECYWLSAGSDWVVTYQSEVVASTTHCWQRCQRKKTSTLKSFTRFLFFFNKLIDLFSDTCH